MSDHSKRVAIVTGAASGIGRSIAYSLAKEGCRVIIADKDEVNGPLIANELHGLFVTTDLSKKESCENLVQKTRKLYGSVEILINNAGYQHIESIENFPVEKWENMIALMVTAPFILTKNVWPLMKERKWGRIVNIASIHGLVGSPFKSAYVTAKHGLVGFTKVAALEGGEFGITVNAICPSYVSTKLLQDQISSQAVSRGIPEKDVITKVMLERSAIKRLVEPDEVASLVNYLCSDAASAITGSTWPIDTGWTAS